MNQETTNEEKESWWWGYKHKNGHIQAKRYFSHNDIDEADESPFVLDTYGPFKAYDRDDVIGIFETAFAIKFEPIPKQEVFDAIGYDKNHE